MMRKENDMIQATISKLNDDPYRSLAGCARRAGACVKDATPFAEFLWADFFRWRIELKLLESQPEAALAKALTLAHSPST